MGWSSVLRTEKRAGTNVYWKKQPVWSGVTPCGVTNFLIGRDFLELEHRSMQVNGGRCIVVMQVAAPDTALYMHWTRLD